MSHTWPFDQPPNAAAISLRQIVHDGAPVLLVTHDEDDHAWQFLDSSDDPKVEDAVIVCMSHIVEADPTVCEVADLPPGWRAWRERVGSLWVRGRTTEDDSV